MTTKLTIKVNDKTNMTAFVESDAYILVGMNLVKASDVTAVSVLSKIECCNSDGLLHAQNKYIFPVINKEEISNQHWYSAIDSDTLNTDSLYLVVFIPDAIIENDDSTKIGRKICFAELKVCND